MSIDATLLRISQIQSLAVGPTTAQAEQAAPSKTVSGTESFSGALQKADQAGISRAAWESAPPVQSGRLVSGLYAPRQQAAAQIAKMFGLSVTSGYRDPEHNASVGGVPGSYHTKGLAFDFVGTAAQMEKAKAWAQSHPEMFREVLVHNVGSGMHLHLAFRSA